ncbi:MAG: hypothetical protein ACRC80_17025, partial [Waterburya sp.]
YLSVVPNFARPTISNPQNHPNLTWDEVIGLPELPDDLNPPSESYSASSTGLGAGSISINITKSFQSAPYITLYYIGSNSYANPGSINDFRQTIIEKNWDYLFEEDESLSDTDERKYYARINGNSKHENQYITTGDFTGTSPTNISTMSGSLVRFSNKEYYSNIEASRPFVVNDHQTLYIQLKATKAYVEEFNQEYNFLNFPLTHSGHFPVTSSTSQYNLTQNLLNEEYNSLFNKGDIGLYSYSKIEKERIKEENQDRTNYDQARVQLDFAYQQWENYPLTRATFYSGGSPPTGSGSDVYNTIYSFTTYYLAYKDELSVQINPGVAIPFNQMSNENKAKISAYFSDNQSDKYIDTGNTGIRQQLDYISSYAINTTFGSNSTTAESTSRSSVPTMTLEKFDLDGEIVVLLIKINADYFFCYCLVTDIATTFPTNYQSPSTQWNYQDILNINLEILEVKKIKPFAFTFPLLFTLRGCDVFKYLDPNMISFIEQPAITPGQSDRRFLTATLLPISEKDTQSLCFEIIENDIVFIGIQGGDITDSKIDPDNAPKWTQYFPDKFPRPTVF